MIKKRTINISIIIEPVDGNIVNISLIWRVQSLRQEIEKRKIDENKKRVGEDDSRPNKKIKIK